MSTTNQVATSVATRLAEEIAAPPLAVPIQDVTKIWVLFYRHGVNPGCYKGFYHSGDMRSAVDRAKRHCEAMGYRYIFIRPFVVDIDAEEVSRGRAVTGGQTS